MTIIESRAREEAMAKLRARKKAKYLLTCLLRYEGEPGYADITILATALLDSLPPQSPSIPSSGVGGHTAAARDVLAERARQVAVEGWTSEHDAQHASGELAEAAACYLIYRGGHKPRLWPWSREWWKPKGRRRNLVRAGALILAEIERFDRISAAIAKAGVTP